MKIEYRILNPLIGGYSHANTLEEADALAKQIAWDLYTDQSHKAPISKILITDEGAEVWGTPDA